MERKSKRKARKVFNFFSVQNAELSNGKEILMQKNDEVNRTEDQENNKENADKTESNENMVDINDTTENEKGQETSNECNVDNNKESEENCKQNENSSKSTKNVNSVEAENNELASSEKKEELNERFGIIKLVSLNKLLDKPIAWVEEALKGRLMEQEVIQVDSDTDIEDNITKLTPLPRTKSDEINKNSTKRRERKQSFTNKCLNSDFSDDDNDLSTRVTRTRFRRSRESNANKLKSKFDYFKQVVNKQKVSSTKSARDDIDVESDEELPLAKLKSKISQIKPSTNDKSNVERTEELSNTDVLKQQICKPVIIKLSRIDVQSLKVVSSESNQSQQEKIKSEIANTKSSSDSDSNTPLKQIVHQKKLQENEEITVISSDDEQTLEPIRIKIDLNNKNVISCTRKRSRIEDEPESTDNSENHKKKKSEVKEPIGSKITNQKEDNINSKERLLANKEILKTSNNHKEDNDNEKEKAHAIESSSSSDEPLFKLKPKNAKLVNSDSDSSDDNSYKKTNNSNREKAVQELKTGNESSGSDSSDFIKKKTRRRIITAKDNNDSSSDSDIVKTQGKSRKKIRRVLKNESLSKETKDAAKEEMDRKKRIQERQKLYNELCDINWNEKSKLDKVVLDFDTKRKKDLISVHPKLVEKLKPHQASGIKFMWDCCFESLDQIKNSKGSGCILAHCMGLGKTLQVVALIHTLMTHSKTGIERVMVVCPLSTVLNWVNEFKIWLDQIDDTDEINVYEITKFKKMIDRAYQISDWYKNGGVLVIGYEMFRNLTHNLGQNKRVRKKISDQFQQGLVDPGPDLVVCDEGHLLKNEKTRISVAMNSIKTLRRIVLTGTPLQNNLKEYYCMIQFVKPNLLGKYKEYTNRFVNPITNGQYTDSTPRDIEIMKRRSHVLHKLLDGVVQRRDYSVLAPFLPPKHEYVVYLTLHEIQIKLYQIYLSEFAKRVQGGKAVALFTDFQELQRIWTHPRSLRFYSDKYEKNREKQNLLNSSEDSEGSLRDFIDDNEESSSTTESTSEEGSDNEAKSGKPGRRRITRAQAVKMKENNDEEEEIIETKKDNPTEWWCKYVQDEVLDDIKYSSKLTLLFQVLKKCEAIGDKVLVFSQSLFSLDLIEYFLEKIDNATQNGDSLETLGGYAASWTLGLDYFRLDGSSSVDNRAMWCKNFNDANNPRARLFLISTKAGGLGINLVAANRVIIFDVSWNPSHDIQSIFRVYRFGQTKPCYIYRFIAMGTMEEKVYERQVTKQAISKRVIDEHQIDRHYNQDDLNELYKFSPTPLEERPLPLLPKDRLFAELLKENEKNLFKYHEHDSLLENKEEEELDEEERKAAWDEFENEKKAPPMTSNYMNSVPQFQMSVHEASFAMEVMLRQQNPNWSDLQIRSSVPLLVQQMYSLAANGDWTMYNRILEYKVTLQQQQWAAQTRLMGSVGTIHGVPQTSTSSAPITNPNEVVQID